MKKKNDMDYMILSDDELKIVKDKEEQLRNFINNKFKESNNPNYFEDKILIINEKFFPLMNEYYLWKCIYDDRSVNTYSFLDIPMDFLYCVLEDDILVFDLNGWMQDIELFRKFNKIGRWG